jgi:hypothetical protein
MAQVSERAYMVHFINFPSLPTFRKSSMSSERLTSKKKKKFDLGSDEISFLIIFQFNEKIHTKFGFV